MSSPPSAPSPIPYPNPGPAPGRRPQHPKALKSPGQKAGWGWLEWFIILLTLLPALLFIPGMHSVRTATRIAAYLLGLAFWAGVVQWGKNGEFARRYPPKVWLLFCAGWLGLLMVHPNNYSLSTAAAQVMLYVAVMSPAFWAGEAVQSPQQIRRVMAVLFLCNAASATVGLGQVFYPNRLNPPVIPAMMGQYEGENVMYETTDGRKIFRPCGLTDTPGAAAPAGAAAALIGLCFVLRPIPWWRRLVCLGLAFVGVAVIYYSQVRTSMVMLVICFAVLATLMTIRGNLRGALALVGGGGLIIVGSLLWVARTMGSAVFERFGTLLGTDPGRLYLHSRGGYVTHSLTEILVQYPFGYGLGWWGMVHSAFRDPHRISPVWVEVMIPAWIYDGGFLLIVGYCGAIAVAMFDSLRIALRCRDKELAFWAAVVVAQNLSVVANCFSYPSFLSTVGVQFWVLAAALHAADAQSSASAQAVAMARRRGPRPARPGPAAP